MTEMFITEPVQNLLDHTVFRLICSLSTDEPEKINNNYMVLKCKWDMDGASRRQRFQISKMMTSVCSALEQPVGINHQVRPEYDRVKSFKFVKET